MRVLFLSLTICFQKIQSGSDSSDSDSELVGPPVPPQHAAQEDKDELVGPPLPPGYRDNTANDDDDDDDEAETDEEDDDDDVCAF